ncbi:hypothetical protein HAPAU_41840 [Halalkalicoccus paucihalophilus]|uniref:DUF4868 domain-containing protein n=1 Tax=Halalkalicoccus paucihalophilus TaxID=1008153 RepID=A0A151A7Z1_9EURY|nr:Kiwa anti-phage protein KwaB-like domain-containing protein [Halalkalicoccus paucihalophilus]KYH23704.1 hypothetical protein HAPAU_41840 [Halalkalicoccus paucihalophilus]
MSSGTESIETLRDARGFADSSVDIELLLVRKQENTPDVGKLRIGADIQDKIAEITIESLNTHISKLEDGTVQARPLDIGNTVGDESVIECEQISNLPDTELFRLLDSRSDHGWTSYSEDPKPDFQFVRISEPDGKVLVGLKTYTDVTVVDTSKRLILTNKNNATEYRRVRDNLLIFEPRFSAFCYDGWIFIVKPKPFEKVFEMREEYERCGQEVIDSLEKAGITFANPDKTTSWLMSQINMMRAMYEIYENDIHTRITPDMVESSIKKYKITDRYSIEYSRNGEQIELSIGKYEDRWRLLKLLGGKFAEDDIMNSQWEIDAGRRL